MLLETTDLSVRYETLKVVNHVVNQVSIGVEEGEVVGVVGESGCGKSTLALALLGLTRPRGRITEGSVRLKETELLGLSEADMSKIRGDKIGLITQNPRASLNPSMRIGDQIAGVYRAHRTANAREAKEVALEALRWVGMNDPQRRYNAYPHEMSGGMAQRAVIAIATICRPSLVIADEPTSGLDVTIQAQILDDLARAVSEVGSSMLLITQDLGVIANYADRVYVMHAGEVVEGADTITLFETPSQPATIALLGAQQERSSEVPGLHGMAVDGRRLPAGCWLQSRCPFRDADSGCDSEHPKLRTLSEGHLVRCHRSEALVERTQLERLR